LELWGGVECTVVRIGDEFRDQVVETGHAARMSDLDAMAELGVKATRYPIVWETVAPEVPTELDFSWHDARLARLKEWGIRVIAGLIHHGSGPRYASMLDPHFPTMLGEYAAKVAKRYPWIEAWTPVNEPLTTARFSCLYGHWYPHGRDIETMLRGLANECLGTLYAMREIRKVNPAAQLVVTEDMGKTFSTDHMAYQAKHENERRWLSLDLLAGRVVPGHRFYSWLLRAGVTKQVLDELATAEGKPDIIGINHYLTSERFLDHRVERYPDVEPGSNGVDMYCDLEAVRMSHLKNQVGPGRRLREVWDRYEIPIAYTEVHHGCSRDEQIRWLVEVWEDCEKERRKGADIRAVTLWSMFGAVDWRSLLTRKDNHYDPGVFDTRGSVPRPTLIAKAAATLGRGEKFEHPLLDLPGWWKRPGRCHGRRRFDMLPRDCSHARPILITGATGTLGRAFSRICAHRGLVHVLTRRDDLDITNSTSIAAALERHKPWAIINAAGFVRTWEAEEKAEECFAANVAGPELLAKACKLAGIPLVTFSSDLVFDGKLGRPYVERDAPTPTCAYGRSKAELEARLLELDSDVLIIRTSAFFGPWDRYNFLINTVEQLRKGEEVVASDRKVVSPTYVPDLVQATLDLLLDEEKGIWHLTNEGAVSWHDLACEAADWAKLGRERIRTPEHEEAADTSMTSSRGVILRGLDGGLSDFFDHSEPLRLIA
jgi:dTDP-4-dehydrorhamnose reductase